MLLLKIGKLSVFVLTLVSLAGAQLEAQTQRPPSERAGSSESEAGAQPAEPKTITNDQRLGVALMLASITATGLVLGVLDEAASDLKIALVIAAALHMAIPTVLNLVKQYRPAIYSRIPLVRSWKPGWQTYNRMFPILYGGAAGCLFFMRSVGGL